MRWTKEAVFSTATFTDHNNSPGDTIISCGQWTREQFAGIKEVENGEEYPLPVNMCK